jgi:hypothetical protein
MKKSIENMFANGAKSLSKKNDYKTKKEWKIKGASIFTMDVLGPRRLRVVKSFGELSRILYNLKIVNSVRSGRALIPKLYDLRLQYNSWGYVTFTKVKNRGGVEACRISRGRLKD